jgi:hypothetical protein
MGEGGLLLGFHTCNGEVSPMSGEQTYLQKIREVGFAEWKDVRCVVL